MAVLDIRTYPDPVLTEKAEDVEEFDGSLLRLIDDMAQTLYSSETGIGLAATQVGVSKRVFILDLSSAKGEETPLVVCVNPEITEAEGEDENEEGCLSMPGFTAKIKRAGRVVVEARNRAGEPLKIEGTGILARALQHEIDHLDGKLIIDRLTPLKKQFARKRLKKSLAKTG